MDTITMLFAMSALLQAVWHVVQPFMDALPDLLGPAALAIVVDPVTLEKGLKTTFFKAYDAGTPFYPTVCTEVPSTAKEEKYGWLGTAPVMSEWVDERSAQGLLDHDYTIVNNHYEATLSVDKDSLEDDQTNQLDTRVSDMASRARRHPDSLLATLLTNGESTACYDGQYFFDTDHSEGDSGTLDNDLTYDATDHTAVTQAEFKLAFKAALEKLLSYTDDRGQPFLEDWELNSSNLVAIVPYQLRQAALETLNADLISNTTNVYQNQARVVVNTRLSSGAKWYLAYTGAPIKPFIFQNRQPIRSGFLGDQSESGFMRRYYHFGVDARYNMGYGLWQFCVLTTFN